MPLYYLAIFGLRASRRLEPSARPVAQASRRLLGAVEHRGSNAGRPVHKRNGRQQGLDVAPRPSARHGTSRSAIPDKGGSIMATDLQGSPSQSVSTAEPPPRSVADRHTRTSGIDRKLLKTLTRLPLRSTQLPFHVFSLGTRFLHPGRVAFPATIALQQRRIARHALGVLPLFLHSRGGEGAQFHLRKGSD
jgi:hypothetical protein